MEDARFKDIATDPRFRPLPSRLRKVKIDKRFKGMFTDEKFKVKCTVDERGRPAKLSSTKHLRKFYELSSEDSDSEKNDTVSDGEGVVQELGIEEGKKLIKTSDNSETQYEMASSTHHADHLETESNEKSFGTQLDGAVNVAKQKLRKRKKKRDAGVILSSSSEDEGLRKEINPLEDYARGEIMMSSSDEDDEGRSSDDESRVKPFDQEAHGDHYWGELDEDAESTEEATYRLAVQNMDWDRMKACDLFMLFNSFKPASGTVHSVKIYPSEFGKEKMKEDDLFGPKELKKVRLSEEGEAEGRLLNLTEKDQKKVMLENLRQYQLNRLKYYYAVVEFDSAMTANSVYTQCDGQEYLASCTQLDLRFVPDGMDFAEDEVKDSANHVPDNYEPKFFINPALGQSLVRCTWDENGPERYDMLNKKYKADELEELDMKAYLASDSDQDLEDADEIKKEENNLNEEVSENSKITKIKQTRTPRKDSQSLVVGNSDDDEMNDIENYRKLLLGSINKKSNKDENYEMMDMEITWDTGLKDATEELVKRREKRKVKSSQEMSLFDKKHAEKKGKQKKKDFKSMQKKKESVKKKEYENKDMEKTNLDDGLNLIVMNMDKRKKKHFDMSEIVEYQNMTKSKRKRKLRKNQLKNIEDDFKMNVNDERFSAIYTSSAFNIEPTSQHYKKTKGMEAIINEKQRRVK